MPVKNYEAAKYSTIPNGMQLLNVIRDNASAQYKEWVPVATQDNIADVGNPILQYEAAKNEFLAALANRIGLVIASSKSYNNPLKPFKKGLMTLGETVEEYFVNISKAEPYYLENDMGMTDCEDAFKRRIPDVKTAFHKRNRQDKFAKSVSNDDLRTAFLSYQNVEDLVSRIIESLYTSDEFSEFLLMKNVLFEAGRRGALYTVPIADYRTSQDEAKKSITTIRGNALNMTFMSDKYNYMGVMTHTPIEDQIIFILTSFAASVDVEVLASAFNMDKTQFLGARIILDDFGGLENEGVVAIAVDREWFMVFDTYFSMTEIYNPARLYWNYFLHHWQILSYSPFKNAIAYTTQTPTVTDVTISPTTSTVAQATGGTATFTATVTGDGLVSPNVTWTPSVDGLTLVEDKDTHSVTVTVPANFQTTPITITATSVTDTTKTATATITVTPSA